MSTMMAMVAALALLAAPGARPGRDLRYWGKAGGDGSRGRVECRGQLMSVGHGDEIPGWGVVLSVGESALMVRHRLSADEKRAREAAGLVAVDVQDVRIPKAARTLAERQPPAR